MCCSTHPKSVAACILRVSFGLSLLLVGFTHYMDFNNFLSFTVKGLGMFDALGFAWAFVLPLLMIFGGALITLGIFFEMGTFAAGIALGSIPVGLMLKSTLGGMTLSDTMPGAVYAWIWILVYYFVVKSACHGCCKPGMSCGPCGTGGCGDGSCGTCKPAKASSKMVKVMPKVTKRRR